VLTGEEESDLAGMAWNWEGAYAFQVTDGVWIASAVTDPACVLTADTADELRRKVRDDYASRRPTGPGPLLGERMST
jgi:hypothetical protein